MTTQTATDLRGICGNDRLKKCWKANETEQKRTQTNGKNHKKFQIPVGKDEVGGSNPPSSSRKLPKSYDFGSFSYFFGKNGVGQNVGQPPDPHRDPHVEMCGKVQRAPDRKFRLPVRYFFLLAFYMTCSMKFPMVSAASSCFCLVAWV